MSTPEDLHQPLPTPIAIADASLPVDAGLSGLGLLMSLAGGVTLVIAIGVGSMMMFTLMLLGGGHTRGAGIVLLLALAAITTTIMRSWAHRAAGQRLLYDGPGTPRSAIRRYFVYAGLHTAVIAVALGSQGVSARSVGLIVVALVGWPIALGIALADARFKALLDQQTIPQGEDKGFEGAAILMIVLGLTGLVFGGVMAISTFDQIGPILEYVPLLGLSSIAIVTMLILRSSFHVRAGVRGVREAHRDRVAAAATQYGNFGVLAGAIICGLVVVMTLIGGRGHVEGAEVVAQLVTMIFLVWALATWPLIIRRFFVERQFADLLVNDEAPHRRAPDRGLTALGWLLFGQAVLALSMVLPTVLTGSLDPEAYQDARDPMSELVAMFQGGGSSQWWSIGAAALQLAASWQLIRMRPNHKRLVNLWGVAATLVAVYVNYPQLQAMTKGGINGAFTDSLTTLNKLAFLAVAISLVAPIATLILVNRKQRELPAAVLQRQRVS